MLLPAAITGGAAMPASSNPVASVWPGYFPDADFSYADPKSVLASNLSRSFSAPPAQTLLSQVAPQSRSTIFSVSLLVLSVILFGMSFGVMVDIRLKLMRASFVR